MWLNLHQFLYVLGRHEIQHRDRTRPAQVNAPNDEARGLASLSPEEQRVWREAVTFYARDLSKLDAVFDAACGKASRSQFKPILDEVWKPYLEGKGTRDEALAAIVARLPD